MEKIQNIENQSWIHVVKGVGISFIITFILLLIFSILLTFTDISESVINPTIIGITVISILIGSAVANIKIKKNGLLNGGVIGGIYIFLIYIISSVVNQQFSLNMTSIIMIILGIVFGILGGIIGVNIKN